jgi:hypothetical protein
MKITLKKGFKLLEKAKPEYIKWYDNLPESEKSDYRNWDEFVRRSVEVNNANDGTEEDLFFNAMDAVSKNESDNEPS